MGYRKIVIEIFKGRVEEVRGLPSGWTYDVVDLETPDKKREREE